MSLAVAPLDPAFAVAPITSLLPTLRLLLLRSLHCCCHCTYMLLLHSLHFHCCCTCYYLDHYTITVTAHAVAPIIAPIALFHCHCTAHAAAPTTPTVAATATAHAAQQPLALLPLRMHAEAPITSFHYCCHYAFFCSHYSPSLTSPCCCSSSAPCPRGNRPSPASNLSSQCFTSPRPCT